MPKGMSCFFIVTGVTEHQNEIIANMAESEEKCKCVLDY